MFVVYEFTCRRDVVIICRVLYARIHYNGDSVLNMCVLYAFDFFFLFFNKVCFIHRRDAASIITTLRVVRFICTYTIRRIVLNYLFNILFMCASCTQNTTHEFTKPMPSSVASYCLLLCKTCVCYDNY